MTPTQGSMKFSEQTSEKIYATMRSLFRYYQLINSKYTPEILLENEKTILKKRLATLNEEEILFIAINFHSFMESQNLQSEMDNQNLAISFSKFLEHLN